MELLKQGINKAALGTVEDRPLSPPKVEPGQHDGFKNITGFLKNVSSELDNNYKAAKLQEQKDKAAWDKQFEYRFLGEAEREINNSDLDFTDDDYMKGNLQQHLSEVTNKLMGSLAGANIDKVDKVRLEERLRSMVDEKHKRVDLKTIKARTAKRHRDEEAYIEDLKIQLPYGVQKGTTSVSQLQNAIGFIDNSSAITEQQRTRHKLDLATSFYATAYDGRMNEFVQEFIAAGRTSQAQKTLEANLASIQAEVRSDEFMNTLSGDLGAISLPVRDALLKSVKTAIDSKSSYIRGLGGVGARQQKEIDTNDVINAKAGYISRPMDEHSKNGNMLMPANFTVYNSESASIIARSLGYEGEEEHGDHIKYIASKVENGQPMRPFHSKEGEKEWLSAATSQGAEHFVKSLNEKIAEVAGETPDAVTMKGLDNWIEEVAPKHGISATQLRAIRGQLEPNDNTELLRNGTDMIMHKKNRAGSTNSLNGDRGLKFVDTLLEGSKASSMPGRNFQEMYRTMLASGDVKTSKMAADFRTYITDVAEALYVDKLINDKDGAKLDEFNRMDNDKRRAAIEKNVKASDVEPYANAFVESEMGGAKFMKTKAGTMFTVPDHLVENRRYNFFDDTVIPSVKQSIGYEGLGSEAGVYFEANGNHFKMNVTDIGESTYNVEQEAGTGKLFLKMGRDYLKKAVQTDDGVKYEKIEIPLPSKEEYDRISSEKVLFTDRLRNAFTGMVNDKSPEQITEEQNYMYDKSELMKFLAEETDLGETLNLDPTLIPNIFDWSIDTKEAEELTEKSGDLYNKDNEMFSEAPGSPTDVFEGKSGVNVSEEIKEAYSGAVEALRESIASIPQVEEVEQEVEIGDDGEVVAPITNVTTPKFPSIPKIQDDTEEAEATNEEEVSKAIEVVSAKMPELPTEKIKDIVSSVLGVLGGNAGTEEYVREEFDLPLETKNNEPEAGATELKTSPTVIKDRATRLMDIMSGENPIVKDWKEKHYAIAELEKAGNNAEAKKLINERKKQYPYNSERRKELADYFVDAAKRDPKVLPSPKADTATKEEKAAIVSNSKLNKTSQKRLGEVHSDLAKVIAEASKRSPSEFIITEGLRTLDRQKDVFVKGASQTILGAKHINGGAIDFAIIKNGKPTWENVKEYHAVAKTIEKVAKEMGINIRAGYTFGDAPHIELMFEE